MSHPLESLPEHTLGGIGYLPRQWQAVGAAIGPLLVLAGPGAGKTRCLTGRIQYLIDRHQVDPTRICAITFTNKAAEEIQSRLQSALGPTITDRLTLGTIHAICLKILRTHVTAAGLPQGFGVAADDHQRLILRRLGKSKYPQQSQLLTLFSRKRLQNDELDARDQTLFQKYEAELHRNRLIDFDEILVRTRDLLQSVPEVLSLVQQQWDHLLVDEFQDLDSVQYSILRLIVSPHRSLFCVGDDDQSIFSWRGADPAIVIHFLQDFEIVKPIILNLNCRSTIAIYDTARRILPAKRYNPRQEIRAFRTPEFPVIVQTFANDREETQWVVEDIQRDLATHQLRRGQYAILYRKHEIGDRLEAALIAQRIPCQLGVGRSISADPIIAQVISSLRLILDPESDIEHQQFALCVLPKPAVDLIAIAKESTFTAKLRGFAKRNPGQSKPCWRLLYQIENLLSLGRTQQDLKSLIDAIMAMGVGQYTSPVDDLLDQLPDPAGNPLAQSLAKAFHDLTFSGRILLVPDRGWEIAVRYLFTRARKSIAVEFLSPELQVTRHDLVLRRDDQPTVETSATVMSLGRGIQESLGNLLAALQLLECNRLQKSFPEYVVFDTKTTDKDTEQCEVVELAAVRVRDGAWTALVVMREETDEA